MDDVLQDTINLFGDAPSDDGKIRYGPLVLTTAPKEGKANTLLADHLFSPSLLLAEQIERGLIPIAGKTVLELGSGCALPSLLCAISPQPASTVVITDYPDHTIMDNLKENVSRNESHFNPECTVHVVGYEWGQDVQPLLSLSHPGFDVVILSDLLHFDQSHPVLLSSLTRTLRKSPSARTYVAAGKYTLAHHCDHFLREGEKARLAWEEGIDDPEWRGSLEVSGGGLDREQLGVRKGMCRWWVGRWKEFDH
ncbi:putative methyltransferase-domain-containing protein [Cristinia sonorae]|uniref:Methyltransferase-domain-containing protein n=1 Tax=Cristinia sonorae TaxID=1940300 RepID=A0A8K0UGF5_9AGAR|nr:putative methyltransferase-domain-containing protein [Cristinia sonorae]